MNLYTIGFTGKSAERFFTLLRENGVQRLVDTRLYPSTQLSGFAKAKDLAWLLTGRARQSFTWREQAVPTPSCAICWRRFLPDGDPDNL
ncbi:MAG: DUF488 domain-containing protein [Chloroflexota bacterium]|nr:DUF488 domain-containing protein [Chloroflexota bacterium]